MDNENFGQVSFGMRVRIAYVRIYLLDFSDFGMKTQRLTRTQQVFD